MGVVFFTAFLALYDKKGIAFFSTIFVTFFPIKVKDFTSWYKGFIVIFIALCIRTIFSLIAIIKYYISRSHD
jgi:hypothetical protein